MTAPIFVLCHGRSGSTLLRYILNSHSEVCCPAEVQIGSLCASLGRAIALTDTRPHRKGRLDHQSRAQVRQHVNDIMLSYCAAEGKHRWCDKSPPNLEHAELLSAIFPDAQFICLHRHGLDVVRSCMDAFRFGYPGRLGEFIARRPDNVLDALAESWEVRTRALLGFEQSRRSRCIRIRYEDLVTRPASVIAEVCEFLRIKYEDGMIENAFQMSETHGPGDVKLRFTSGIHNRSVGRGLELPFAMLPVSRLAKLNELFEVLGYSKLVRRGVTRTSVVRDQSTDADATACCSAKTADTLQDAVTALMANRRRRDERLRNDPVALEIIEGGRVLGRWLLDGRSPVPARIGDDVPVAGTIALSAEDLDRIVSGKIEIGEAVAIHAIRFVGRNPKRAAQVARELFVLPDGARPV